MKMAYKYECLASGVAIGEKCYIPVFDAILTRLGNRPEYGSSRLLDFKSDGGTLLLVNELETVLVEAGK